MPISEVGEAKEIGHHRHSGVDTAPAENETALASETPGR